MKKQAKAQLRAIVFPLWKNRNKANDLITDGEDRMIISFYKNNIEYNGIIVNEKTLKLVRKTIRKNKENYLDLKIITFP